MATQSGTIGFNDLLYLHPSNTPRISLVQYHLIGTENYGVWSREMPLALQAKNKIGFINGSCVRPTTNNPALHQWERCNAIVLSWIMSSVSKEIYNGIIYCNDASKVWEDLKERFDKICGSRIFSLQDIVHLSQGSSSISVYFSMLKRLWDEYHSLVTLPSCECTSARKYLNHEEQQRLIQFLMGLNDSSNHIRSQILMMTPLPSVNQAYSIIVHEEANRQALSCQPVADIPTAAFYSSSIKKHDLVKCDHCQIQGHTKENCFRLIGYPPGHKLHKKFPQPKPSKFNQKYTKPHANHSFNTPVESGHIEESTSTSVMPHTFNDAQYRQILKLLGDSSPTNA